jgi:mannose-6-phosphate isomerase-like protein (cupin superfamily)
MNLRIVAVAVLAWGVLVVTSEFRTSAVAETALETKPGATGTGALSDPKSLVADGEQVPWEKFPWGNLKWICNGKLSPGAAQTIGLSEIPPGMTNPVHFHPNCEEVLYVLSGQCRHTVDGKAVDLKAGMLIRIPAKVKHNLTNTGNAPLRCLMSFSSGDRQTVFLDAPKP